MMNSVFEVRGKVFAGGTHVMGILNVTPDSFFPLSRVGDDVAERALEMVRDGAEILDIGGQSTRPGHKEVGALEELSRVIPAVRAVRAVTDAPISVDTYLPEVAEAALEAGADMINDVSCLRNPALARIAARYGAALCIMHDRRQSAERDLMKDKLTGLVAAADTAVRAGVSERAILLDGGIGFNKSADEDRQLLANYAQLKLAGYPLLLGTSRKSFFGGEVGGRLSATLETTAQAVRDGILFVRVHDVAENKSVIDALSGENR